MQQSEIKAAFKVLKRSGWFARIDPEFQALLERDASLVQAKRGEQLYHYGDPGAGLFGIVSGSVLLSFPRRDGELIPFVPFGEGYWLGDLAVLSGKPGLVSIEVRTDCTAVNIPTKAVLELVKQEPRVYRAFYELNRINIELALRLVAAQTAETTEKKILLRLDVFSDFAPADDGWIHITSEELAVQLGVSLRSVRRAIKAMSETGHVETGYAKIRIANPDALNSWNKSLRR